MTNTRAIEIPDATGDPDAYVGSLLETLGDRDPVGQFTIQLPQKMAGHDIAHLNRIVRTIEAVAERTGDL